MDPESKWITEYENKEKIYTNFNKEKVSIIKIYYIYLDYEKKIYNIKTDKEYIENNEFTCERQIYLIKKFQYNIEKKHKLIGMLEYKININSDEIDDIIHTVNDNSIFVRANGNNQELGNTTSILDIPSQSQSQNNENYFEELGEGSTINNSNSTTATNTNMLLSSTSSN